MRNDNRVRFVPVVADHSADMFVDSALVPRQTLMVQGELVTTGPLVTGKSVSLLGISLTAHLLESGVMDMTDIVDPTISLENIYVKINEHVLRLGAFDFPSPMFTMDTSTGTRHATLNTSICIQLNKDTKDINGVSLVDLTEPATDNLNVKLAMLIAGSVNVETGVAIVRGCNVTAPTQNATDGLLGSVSPPVEALVDLVASATVIGYDLCAYRTNSKSCTAN